MARLLAVALLVVFLPAPSPAETGSAPAGSEVRTYPHGVVCSDRPPGRAVANGASAAAAFLGALWIARRRERRSA